MVRILLYAILITFIPISYVSSIPVGSDGDNDAFAVPQQLDGRIVGGKETSITKHGHQVSLRHKSCDECQYSHTCGGSIYNASVIVTAAHCVNRRNASNFMVVAGTNHRRGADGYIVPVARIVMHEKYNASNTDNDVALMFLAIDLPINNLTIAPIKLASKNPTIGVQVTVTGWGTTSAGGVASDVLQEVDVPTVSKESCQKAYGMDSITDGMLCAGSPLGGKDACQGDSGGPLTFDSELLGIVSWGEGCAEPDFPGVYASVPYFKDWIMNVIEGGGPPPIENEDFIDWL